MPGVILGHNANLAWGSTNADVVSARVYSETFAHNEGVKYRTGTQWSDAVMRRESFNDRFGAPRKYDYVATRHGFVLENTGFVRHAVQWDELTDTHSPVAAFLALDRAGSIEDGLRALAQYPGPTQNFALAQTDGRAAFSVAGAIPNDPAWGLSVANGARRPATPLAFVPFAQLPHVAPRAQRARGEFQQRRLWCGIPVSTQRVFQRAVSCGRDRTPPARAAESRRRSIAQHSS